MRNRWGKFRPFRALCLGVFHSMGVAHRCELSPFQGFENKNHPRFPKKDRVFWLMFTLATQTKKMNVLFFENKEQLCFWFEENHLKERELFLGYHKTHTGKPSVSWPGSVEVTLCFGWIDGVRKSIDANTYFIRFSRRKPNSIWSVVNNEKAETLIANGLMKPEGLAAFNVRKEKKSGIYSYENDPLRLELAYELIFKSNKAAWEWFMSQAPSYCKAAIHWVMTAKQEKTREKRFKIVFTQSMAGKRIF